MVLRVVAGRLYSAQPGLLATGMGRGLQTLAARHADACCTQNWGLVDTTR
jgi:hypothetical protein